MDLSVIIVSYDSRFFLELCLRSLKESTNKIESEVIVIDNNSSDDTINMVESLFPYVLLIKNKVNLGFASANKGVKQALLDDEHLRAGLNVHSGKVTCLEVAQDLGYDYVPALDMLNK